VIVVATALMAASLGAAVLMCVPSDPLPVPVNGTSGAAD
jgi:hypothetical protein